MATFNLNIPAGIRFDCSGCGNCCMGWPVPLTPDDVVRLNDGMARPLRTKDRRLQSFTHSLEKRSDGRCAHLTDLNRCGIHEELGPAAKPAMCQLFPYSFTETPDGLYAYVSFASSAVLMNSGQPLTEQKDVLLQKWDEFQRLFPERNRNWSALQLLDGLPLSWNEYLLMEDRLLNIVADRSQPHVSIEKKLSACSAFLIQALPGKANPEQFPAVEARPRIVDQLILKHLFALYLPSNVFSDANLDFNARSLMSEIVQAPNVVSVPDGTDQMKFQQLIECKLGRFSDDIEDLLTRFVYCRIFAKMYFGPCYGHLSLISGIHHLAFVITLIRLAAKQMKLRKVSVDLVNVAEILRTIERRMTQVDLSAEACAAMEVLFTSPSRLQRIAFLAE